jgi:hypothetical protein
MYVEGQIQLEEGERKEKGSSLQRSKSGYNTVGPSYAEDMGRIVNKKEQTNFILELCIVSDEISCKPFPT